MSNQPPYGYDQGGGYQGGGYPPQGGGGYPPPPGPTGKTKVMNLDYNVAAMLAYLPICCVGLVCSIIWIASEPKSNKFLRFHALQSLFLTGIAIILVVIINVLSVGVAVAPGPGGAAAAGFGILSLIGWLVYLILLVLFVIGCVKGYQGQMWKLPVIGDIADKNS